MIYGCERPSCDDCPHCRFNPGTEGVECHLAGDIAKRQRKRNTEEDALSAFPDFLFDVPEDEPLEKTG